MNIRNLDGISKDVFRISLFETIEIGKVTDPLARVRDRRTFLARDLYQVDPKWYIAASDVEYAAPYTQQLHVILVMEPGSYYILDEGALLVIL